MSTNLPLPLLIELAQNRTDEAAKRLGQLQNAQLSAAEKLELLLQYRSEYLTHLQLRASEGLALAQLCNYQQFVQTLDGAIDEQRAVALHADQRLAKGRGQWQHERQQRNAYDTLALRARQEAARVAGRREQQASDERAARSFTSPLTATEQRP